MNEKAKTYVVGFFNGDLKVFNKRHDEIINIKQLHNESMIQDCLFLKNDTLNKKIIVTSSVLPNAELKISELTEVNKKYSFNVLA
jgi:WD40 repeat protein